MTYLSEIKGGQQHIQAVTLPAFRKEYDVIVCGLGTAGSYAALFCAENGLSVLGIESFTCVGGTHTAGGVTSHYFGCPGGRHQPLDREVREFAVRYNCTPPENRKLVVERLLIENGAEIFYNSVACGVYLEEKTVRGLRVLTEDGIAEYGAKIVLDCTADALIATMAGCETQCGRESDGQMQPYTLVSLTKYNGRYKFTNVDFGRVNQFDQWGLSSAILYSRSCAIKKEDNGRMFIAQSPLLGIREGRRIVAEDTVRVEELFADKQTPTPMFYSYSDLDKHGEDIAFDSEHLGDWAVGANLGAYNVTVAVPYRAILPKDYDGLLVPCRALGVDRDVSSCVRMNLDMKKVAEVAADWSMLCVKQNKKLRDVSYEQLREMLLQSGCLDERFNRGYRIDDPRNPNGAQEVCWITEPEKLKDELQSEAPGRAIWSAKRIGAAALPALRECLNAENEDLKKHSAFAVSILGSDEAAEILRDMVIRRDGLMLKDCRKKNNFRGCMAIYWLGRLRDREITEELIRLICDPDEAKKDVYCQSEVQNVNSKMSEHNEVYFQFMSQSVMALVRIGDVHEDLREQIEQAFIRAFSSDEYYWRITQKPRMSSEGNMVQTIKTVAFSAVDRWHGIKKI